MKKFTRRDSLILGASVLAGAAVGPNLRLPAQAQELMLKPEEGASLRVLPPSEPRTPVSCAS